MKKKKSKQKRVNHERPANRSRKRRGISVCIGEMGSENDHGARKKECSGKKSFTGL